ncbi:AAA family ATPase [Vibrio aphrogenes]|uniref:AAA family ATPase n=1 Tax=Vibrio aphrogenes TaxID=1891186 RepID=UPI0013E03539|nr:AAA family ATPase [Vibrio aphrogenes]
MFTGGPGSGKSSVITELKRLGHVCAPESGRAVIQQQLTEGGDALPWADKVKFRDAMLREDQRLYHHYKDSPQAVFFDRGIVDSYGYSKLESLPIADEIIHCCKTYRYSKQVFIFPPWQEIYVNDRERKQDFSTAVATYEMMKQVYQELGYDLLEVPKASVQERVQFILSERMTK